MSISRDNPMIGGHRPIDLTGSLKSILAKPLEEVRQLLRHIPLTGNLNGRRASVSELVRQKDQSKHIAGIEKSFKRGIVPKKELDKSLRHSIGPEMRTKTTSKTKQVVATKPVLVLMLSSASSEDIDKAVKNAHRVLKDLQTAQDVGNELRLRYDEFKGQKVPEGLKDEYERKVMDLEEFSLQTSTRIGSAQKKAAEALKTLQSLTSSNEAERENIRVARQALEKGLNLPSSKEAAKPSRKKVDTATMQVKLGTLKVSLANYTKYTLLLHERESKMRDFTPGKDAKGKHLTDPKSDRIFLAAYEQNKKDQVDEYKNLQQYIKDFSNLQSKDSSLNFQMKIALEDAFQLPNTINPVKDCKKYVEWQKTPGEAISGVIATNTALFLGSPLQKKVDVTRWLVANEVLKIRDKQNAEAYTKLSQQIVRLGEVCSKASLSMEQCFEYDDKAAKPIAVPWSRISQNPKRPAGLTPDSLRLNINEIRMELKSIEEGLVNLSFKGPNANTFDVCGSTAKNYLLDDITALRANLDDLEYKLYL